MTWVHRLSEIDEESMTANCEGCGTRVPLFRRHDQLLQCRNKRLQEKARYREKNRDAIRERNTAARRRRGIAERPRGPGSDSQRRYGLTPEDIARMRDEQQGRCGICQRDDVWRLVVDHCHDTGKVRGLLCDRCNQAIGSLGDRLESVERAVEYLRRTL
jgi:hypothetical protein